MLIRAWQLTVILMLLIGVACLLAGNHRNLRLAQSPPSGAPSWADHFAQRAGQVWFHTEDLADSAASTTSSSLAALRSKAFPESGPEPLPIPCVEEKVLSITPVSSTVAEADGDETKPSAAKLAQDRFAQLKRLVGEWAGKAPHDVGHHEGTFTYKLTAAGSAVMETAFGGSDHEMVTMFHLDGNSIVLTHYCALGNQPRMKCTPTGDATKLVFRFLDGTNLDPAKDMHMHEATIELVADDHIRSTWTLYAAGKPDHSTTIDLKRKE
jgi:hypothetical protein